MSDRGAARATKFILIDHSIQGGGGHYLEYAERVLTAARTAGLEPVLATHRKFEGADAMPWPVHAAYRHAIWLPGRDPPLRAALYRMATKLGVTRLVRRSRRQRNADKADAADAWGGVVNPGGGPDRQRKTSSFAAVTASLLAEIDLAAGDIVFVPTLGIAELMAIRDLLGNSAQARLPSWHLLFRRNIYTGFEPGYDGQRAEFATEFRAVLAELGERVFFYTDTAELSRQYEHMVRASGGHRRFRRVPIPVAPELAGTERCPDPPYHLVYVGDARREKGFQDLPSIIATAADDPVRFTIQCYLPDGGHEPPVQAARDELRALGDRVKLIPHILSSTEYAALLRSADVVLVPYDPSLYYARSSGIFAEAMVAGRPVIVPVRTWMHRHVSAADWRAHRRWLTPEHILEEAPCGDLGPIPATATHLMVVFEQSSHGEFVTIEIEYADGLKRRRTSGGRPGTSSELFPVDRSMVGVQATGGANYLDAARIIYLHLPDDAPLGGIGRAYDGPLDVAACIREIIEHHEAYAQQCRGESRRWAAYHNPDSLVAAVCADAATAPGASILARIPVVILAGGLGTRLRAALPDLPKALAPIGDRSFLSILIEMLAKKGARTFVLCVGYRSAQIHDELGEGTELGVEIEYSVEHETLLGTAGALKLAERFFAPRALVMNGDTYFDIDYEAFCARHLKRRHSGEEPVLATLAVSRVEDAARFGTIETEPETGRITAFVEKRDAGGPGWVNGGVYMLERGILDAVSPGTKCSLERETLPAAVAAGRGVFAQPFTTGFFDIGTPDSLVEFVAFYRDLQK